MTEAAVLQPKRPYGVRDHFLVSCLWLAYNIQWGALINVVLPHQVEAMVGPRKELVLGRIEPIGALIALVIAVVAGALSDRCTHRLGKRRPFLLAGGVINILFLLWMSSFGRGSSVVLFTVCFLGVQLGCNLWGGPYAGLIPDIVPKAQRGTASGWMAVMTALGNIIGALSAGLLIGATGSYHAIYVLIAGALLVLMLITLFGVKETPLAQAPPPITLGQFARSFWLDPKKYRDFYWVLVTRALVTMGIYAILPYFQYFLGDVVNKADPSHAMAPAAAVGILIAIVTGMGVPTSLIAGAWSDRVGRKPPVIASGWMMAAICGTYILVTLHPTLLMSFVVAGLFGIGYGAYQAVDWALAIDVLPGGEDAAKDMGIWHVSLVLPQILAPWISGQVLDFAKGTWSLPTGYTIVFAMAAVWFALGTVFVRQIRGVR